jgi:hypothetical protein
MLGDSTRSSVLMEVIAQQMCGLRLHVREDESIVALAEVFCSSADLYPEVVFRLRNPRGTISPNRLFNALMTWWREESRPEMICVSYMLDQALLEATVLLACLRQEDGSDTSVVSIASRLAMADTWRVKEHSARVSDTSGLDAPIGEAPAPPLGRKVVEHLSQFLDTDGVAAR